MERVLALQRDRATTYAELESAFRAISGPAGIAEYHLACKCAMNKFQKISTEIRAIEGADPGIINRIQSLERNRLEAIVGYHGKGVEGLTKSVDVLDELEVHRKDISLIDEQINDVIDEILVCLHEQQPQ